MMLGGTERVPSDISNDLTSCSGERDSVQMKPQVTFNTFLILTSTVNVSTDDPSTEQSENI